MVQTVYLPAGLLAPEEVAVFGVQQLFTASVVTRIR